MYIHDLNPLDIFQISGAWWLEILGPPKCRLKLSQPMVQGGDFAVGNPDAHKMVQKQIQHIYKWYISQNIYIRYKETYVYIYT